MEDRQIGVGKGRSKREAQQEAARQALVTLAQDDADDVAGEVMPPDEPLAASPAISATDDPAPADAAPADNDTLPAGPLPERSLAHRRVRGAGKREG